VAANKVYNEYIANRNHTHMNATIWSTLTEFVQYLGKEGKCHVEETDKGWYIKYIDRDPEAIARAVCRAISHQRMKRIGNISSGDTDKQCACAHMCVCRSNWPRRSEWTWTTRSEQLVTWNDNVK
jgi:hypothetical protein